MALYEEFTPRPNRLIDAESVYLQSAAYQPVGWYQFGAEAFAEAKRRHKPILLDIGAVWCHWCHVMDHESYENPDIATLINEHFIPIKVDRDERPDIDSRYQVAIQLLNGQGGWPLTVFLTAEGEPFYGGTYFPPEDRYGRRGMRRLLAEVAEAYAHHRQDLRATAQALTERVAEEQQRTAQAQTVDEETYRRIANGVRARFNAEQGGFEQGGPKFPHPGAVELALWQWDATGDDAWRVIAVKTLTAMGRGGIHDQLGGGFHRYATDDAWAIPHFEKMSYDNALLLENYVHAYKATGVELFEEVAQDTLGFLLRDMADVERGGFYTAQDADNTLMDDGSYWTWTTEDLVAFLSPREAAVIAAYYGVRPRGNMPDSSRNVLRVFERPEHIARTQEIPVEQVRQALESGRNKLFDARRRRRAPALNTNKYAGWNALLTSACLEAGVLLGREDATAFALQTLDTMLKDAYEPDHGIYHMFHTSIGARLPGFLEDQVYTIRALLDAFGASGRRDYFETARHLLDLCIAQYWDDVHGGFADVAHDRQTATDLPLLRQPRKVIEDMPTPSPNALAAMLLDRMWLLTHEDRYHAYAHRTLQTFAGYAVQYGPFAASFGLAVSSHLTPPVQVVVIGPLEGKDTRALWDAALQTYRPGRSVAVFPPDAEALPYPARGEQAVAYVCAGHHCTQPLAEIEALCRALRTAGKTEQG